MILRNSRDRERGAALVEFAVLAPLLILLVLGIVEFGWKFGQFNDVRHAAREGARFAAVNAGTNADIEAVVCNALEGLGAGISNVDIALDDDITSATTPDGNRGDTGSITVTATVESLSNVPIITDFLPTELESSIEFRLEQSSTSWGATTTTGACP